MGTSARLRVAQTDQTQTDIEEIAAGLRLAQKQISPKYFYDEFGSQLFEDITRQPEYYPTRTEESILRRHIADIGAALGQDVSLIEFGAGASTKVRILLDHLPGIIVFVPVDISGDHLALAAADLASDYPDIEILPTEADFTRPFDLPQPHHMPARNVVFFPGSTIGNFEPDAALDLLRTMRTVACDGGGLLIGVDLKKDAAILERAYNDAAGVTAAFNRNMLVHLNRAYGTDFDPQQYLHRAIYNERRGRIEMHLVSAADQVVHLDGEAFTINAGEYLLTECSYKYAPADFAALAARAGFAVEHVWTDPDSLFSLQFCRTAD